MSGHKGGPKRGVSPSAPLLSPRRRRPGASLSWCALPFGTGGRCAAPPAVSAMPSDDSVSPSVPAPGPVRPAARAATFIVSPQLLATIERKSLLIPNLPLSLDEVGTLLLYWAIEGEESHFRQVEAVVCTIRLLEHLPLSGEDQVKLRLRIVKCCDPVHFS